MWIEKLFAPDGDGATDAGAADGSDEGAGAAQGDGAGDGGAGRGGPSAQEIAARAGGAFAKQGDKGANGAAAGDGVDPGSKPGAKEGRPDYIPEKFWDAKTRSPNIEAISKAYTTLESAHAALKAEKGYGKAGDKPEAYLPEGLKWADGKKPDRIRDFDAATDPAIGAFRKVAHKHKIPVDMAASLAADFLAELNPLMEAPRTEADIVAELGEGGAQLRDELGLWMGSLFDNKTFSEAELEWAYANFGKDATGVRVLAKVREAMGEKPIPIKPGRQEGDIPSVEEWYAMHRDPRMATDAAFREKVEALGEKVFGTDYAGTSETGVGIPPQRKVDRRERASTQR